MGGCCAPGPAAMVDGIRSGFRETKSNGSSCGGDCAELTTEEKRSVSTGTAAFQVLRAGAQESCSTTPVEKRGTAVDVEKILRLLEVAVEREYVDGLRDRFNAGNQYRENTESLHSSLAESATSVYSAAESAFSKSCSDNSSTGAGESCSLEQEHERSTNNHGNGEGKQRTSFDWAERMEAALESMHHMQRRDPYSELKTTNREKSLGNFERIPQQILTLDTEEKSVQPMARSPCRCQPDVLTEFDDYPRGSSDTNSEEAERDRKTVCSTPVINSIIPTHQAGATSFLSLGLVRCQPREKQAVFTSCIREGSMRLDQSDSTIDQAREVSHRSTEPFSSSFETDQSGAGGADDSYANWLDRHSKELGWKNSSKYKRMVNLSEHETCTTEHGLCTDGESKARQSGLKLLQRQVNGFESDRSRSWTSQGDLAEFEIHTRDDERTSAASLKGGEPSRGAAKSVDDLETNCLTSSRGQGIQEHVLKFCSFQAGEDGQGSFRFTPDIQLDKHSYASSRAIQIRNPSCSFPGNNSQHLQNWARADLSDTAKSGLEGSYKPALTNVVSHQSTSPRYVSDCGGATTLQNPHLLLEIPSNGTYGGLRCSKLNSRFETPKSVFSAGRGLESNANRTEKESPRSRQRLHPPIYRTEFTPTKNLSITPGHGRWQVKVCVRMRPFNDHEKVCPLRQLLCVMGEKVVVKEYDRPSLRRRIDSSDTDLLEFRADCVLDDSYLQEFRPEKKEDSQRRMFESIGLPCLEYALDGCNTTVLAYGQVGTGKTYTMLGDGTENGSGLMPRLAKELMNQLKTDLEGEFEVQVSYLEIYQEKVRDLLAVQKLDQDSRCGSMRSCRASSFDCYEESTYENSVEFDTTSHASLFVGTPRSWSSERIPSVYFDDRVPKKQYLKVREHPVTGPYVEGLLWKNVTTWQDLEAMMMQGAANRTLAPTPFNKLSSRGHTLFTIKLIRGSRRFVNGYPSSSFSVINLVDLAGTEKPQSARKVSVERQDESRYINRSLAQLNDVIVSLSRNKKFISYRDSALTWLLRDYLGGGNSKLFLIAHISPAEQDFQESVNTLRYASRANRIHSIIASYPDHKKQLLVRMKKEIRVLHNLVHDLTKNKITECPASEDLRRARANISLQQCHGSSEAIEM